MHVPKVFFSQACQCIAVSKIFVQFVSRPPHQNFNVKIQIILGRTLFTCSDKKITPGHDYQYLVLLVWGKNILLSHPFPIFDLRRIVHVQCSCAFTNSFYWGTGLPMKRSAVTRTAHYPVTFGTGPYFSLRMHHAYFNIAQYR